MINIYFGERVLYLTLVENFFNSEHEFLYIYNDGLNDLFQNLKTCFTYIKAAGGVVKNQLDEILIIKVEGIWQLPKGKVEPDEDYEQTAVREVVEECNIEEPLITEQLPSTYHFYEYKNNLVLKRTYWFKMIYKGSTEPFPQESEKITEAKWISKKDIFKIMKNSHKSLSKIWEKTY